MISTTESRLASSFRDPSGFLFARDGRLLRQVQPRYADELNTLMESGLYSHLVEKGLLVEHREVARSLALTEGAHKVLEPRRIPFISYPYEWCFSQLKHAALITLRIQETALEYGMSLKDASAYNVQFLEGRPVLIDTLSFECHHDGAPWIAYRQFCQHFLAPLALMAYRDVALSALMRSNIDGVPLPLASRLLPARTKLIPGLGLHLHAHAAAQKKHAGDGAASVGRKVPGRAVLGLVQSLRSTIRRLKWKPAGTEWGAYYDATNYTEAGSTHKQQLVERFLAADPPGVVWDLGSNDGRYSMIAARRGAFTVSADVDPVAVELNYRAVREEGIPNLHPLLMDLTNPSPAIGWAHCERDSMLDRGPADVVMGLALIHHLAISNNVPLENIANFFARAGRAAIIEWVPKSDSQVQRLLATREDVFPNYDRDHFESAFEEQFDILSAEPVRDSERILYHLRRR